MRFENETVEGAGLSGPEDADRGRWSFLGYTSQGPLGMPIRAASCLYCCAARVLVRTAKMARQTMRRRTLAV